MLSRKNPLLFLLLLSIGFASCKKAGVAPGKGKFLVLSALEQQKVTADNAFTLRLFKKLDSANADKGNLFASPLSVSFALGMTSNGAAGETLAAMKRTLNFNGLTQDQVNSYYNNLITNLPQLDPATTLNIANSIWYRKDFSVLPGFVKTNTDSFDAKVQALDFSSSSAVGSINSWVSDQTKGKIPSIIDQINDSDVMFLINAIYFKAGWKEKFDAANTKPLPFYLANGSTVQASFMSGEVDFNYYNEPTINVFELPYTNDKFSMVIMVPQGGNTVHDLIAGLDSAKWANYTAHLMPIKTKITLPKFKFSYDASLKEPLKDLGMGIAFSKSADFTGISAGGNLLITDVKHKAYIETDENGTTAAAVTSVSVGATAIAEPPNALIDHPFVLVIREKNSGLILFAGTVNNPLLTGN